MAPNVLAAKKHVYRVTTILIVVGLIIVVVAVGFQIALNEPAIKDSFQYMPYYPILIGLLVIILAAMGYWATTQENVYFLYVHLCLLLVVCLVQAGIAILSAIEIRTLKIAIRDKISDNYDHFSSKNYFWKSSDFSCCGDDLYYHWPNCYYDQDKCYEKMYPMLFSYAMILVVMFTVGLIIEIFSLTVVCSFRKVLRDRPMEAYELE